VSTFTVTLENAEQVVQDFQFNVPEAIKDRLRVEVGGLASQLKAEIQSNVMGGVLKVRDGHIAGSIFAATFERPNFIGATAGAGPDGYKGRFFEKGYDGEHDVAAHVRNGHPVGAYHRNVVNSLRPWLTPALDQNRGSIDDRLTAAFEGAIPEEM
jgi:hypothetical protein